jgi:hypothetical protein
MCAGLTGERVWVGIPALVLGLAFCVVVHVHVHVVFHRKWEEGNGCSASTTATQRVHDGHNNHQKDALLASHPITPPTTNPMMKFMGKPSI